MAGGVLSPGVRSTAVASTLTPVHSRKLAHLEQKMSLSALIVPHLVQRINSIPQLTTTQAKPMVRGADGAQLVSFRRSRSCAVRGQVSRPRRGRRDGRGRHCLSWPA